MGDGMGGDRSEGGEVNKRKGKKKKLKSEKASKERVMGIREEGVGERSIIGHARRANRSPETGWWADPGRLLRVAGQVQLFRSVLLKVR